MLWQENQAQEPERELTSAHIIHAKYLQKATKGGGGGEKEKELQEEDIEAILAEVRSTRGRREGGRVKKRAAHLLRSKLTRCWFLLISIHLDPRQGRGQDSSDHHRVPPAVPTHQLLPHHAAVRGAVAVWRGVLRWRGHDCLQRGV